MALRIIGPIDSGICRRRDFMLEWNVGPQRLKLSVS